MSAASPRRSRLTVVLVLMLGGVLCAFFTALGAWQLARRPQKLALIARVEARIHLPALPAPGPALWHAVTAERDEYRHVAVRGRFRDDRATFVQAVTERGAGFWVLTPLEADHGFTVLVNRGFVARPPAAPGGVATITGLLRISEPGGAFLRRNDPLHNRWFSRDVAAIAQARKLGPVAPYFIDADAAPDRGSPVGGLTVVRFSNNNLVYAVTWFALAGVVAAGCAIVLREQRRGMA